MRDEQILTLLIIAVVIVILIGAIVTASNKPSSAISLAPTPNPLPPPNPPDEDPAPIQGIMRVDVTRTPQTVDVWIKLSETAKFIVDSNELYSTPVEEHLGGMKEHMQWYSHMIVETREETDEKILSRMKGGAREQWEKQQREWRKEDKREFPEMIRREEQRYREEHTVRLSAYLAYPHRHEVATSGQANEYLDNLEKTYLPKIKSLIEFNAPIRHAEKKRYEF